MLMIPSEKDQKNENRVPSEATENYSIKNSNEFDSELLALEYDKLSKITIKEDMESLEIAFLNLTNENIAKEKELDKLVYRLTPQSDDRGDESGEDNDGDVGGLSAKCKICERIISRKNTVSGMGPTCARKLEEWLSRPEVLVTDMIKGKFKRLSDIKEMRGGLPIMIIRDEKGNTFASDIKRKEKDGRYLAIGISDTTKKEYSEVSSRDIIKNALSVYFDENNYEVVRIFGDAKKYYK